MRLQDELVSLYSLADAPTRKYILSQVPRLPVHFDSQELSALIERGTADADARVAVRALMAWDKIGPQLTLHAYGLDPGRMGLWSAVAMDVAGEAPQGPDPNAPVPDAQAQRATLAQVLEPCRAAILALAAKPGILGEHARQVLGLVPFQGAEETLVDGAADPGRAAGALLALARRDPKLAGATLGRMKRLPPWIAAAPCAAIGGKAGQAAALDAAKGDDEDGQCAAAGALADLGSDGWQELARALSAHRFGWVPVMLAEGLGRLAGSAAFKGLPSVEVLKAMDDTLKNATHELVRIMAVRAMGAIPHEVSIRRATKCLQRGSPLLQAAAIEALVRLEHRAPELAGELAARAQKGPLKLRGVAILGLMTLDRDAALRHAIDLVGATDATSRVEGAYTLGYLHCSTSIELLVTLAGRDPFVPAAIQAEKSLAHYGEDRVASPLLDLLAHREPEVAATALGVLSHFPGEAQAALVPAVEALERRSRPQAGAAILRECGRLGPAVAGLSEYLAKERSDPLLRAGALEGACRSGRIALDVARKAAGDRDGVVALRGAMAQLVAGDAAGAEGLARALASDRLAPQALDAVRDLAVIAGEAGRGGHHARLQRLLGGGRMAPPPPTPARPVSQMVLQPVRVRDTSEVLKAACGTDAPALVARVKALLEQPAARPTVERARYFSRDLSYLGATGHWLDRLAPYRTLIPAAVIILIIALVVMVQMASAVVAPPVSGVVRRDGELGKVGTPIEVSGTVQEIDEARHIIVLRQGGNLTVRVWLPGVDLAPVKVGSTQHVTGLVKDHPGDGVVLVHGMSLKEE